MPFSPVENNFLKDFVKGILLIVSKRIVIDACIFIINFFFFVLSERLNQYKRKWRVCFSREKSVDFTFHVSKCGSTILVSRFVLSWQRTCSCVAITWKWCVSHVLPVWRRTNRMEVDEGVRTIEFCFYGISNFLTARTLTSNSVSYLRGHFGFVYL